MKHGLTEIGTQLRSLEIKKGTQLRSLEIKTCTQLRSLEINTCTQLRLCEGKITVPRALLVKTR